MPVDKKSTVIDSENGPNKPVSNKSHSHLSSGSGFMQMKLKYKRFEIELAFPNPAPTMWAWLQAHCNKVNIAHMNERRMIAETKLCKASVYNGLAELEERNFIWRFEKKIHLNHDMVWHGRKAPSKFVSKCFGEPISILKLKGKRAKVAKVA